MAHGQRIEKSGSCALTLNELCDRFLQHAKSFYVSNGEPTQSRQNYEFALRELCAVCGEEDATTFSARRLQ